MPVQLDILYIIHDDSQEQQYFCGDDSGEDGAPIGALK